VDGFGRAVTYLRVSVTDRCDLRCVYCMAEHMTFLPKAQVLTLEELERLASAFIDLGVRKIRITGGEPLVRKGVMDLFGALSPRLAAGLRPMASSSYRRPTGRPRRRSSPGGHGIGFTSTSGIATSSQPCCGGTFTTWRSGYRWRRLRRRRVATRWRRCGRA
jgi:hypothetical protein